jgi:hypothetical protein
MTAMMVERRCACGRAAVGVVPVASEDGVLLIAVCADCSEDPTAGESGDLFTPVHDAPRKPLATMASREKEEQPLLPLHEDDTDEVEHGAA